MASNNATTGSAPPEGKQTEGPGVDMGSKVFINDKRSRRRKTRARRLLRQIAGGRGALERELLWAIALDGDRRRIEQLSRMLEPAANDPVQVALIKPDE